MNPIDEYISAFLPQKIADMTSDEKKIFAADIGVSLRLVNFWENDERKPGKKRIPKILDYFGLPPLDAHFKEKAEIVGVIMDSYRIKTNMLKKIERIIKTCQPPEGKERRKSFSKILSIIEGY